MVDTYLFVYSSKVMVYRDRQREIFVSPLNLTLVEHLSELSKRCERERERERERAREREERKREKERERERHRDRETDRHRDR